MTTITIQNCKNLSRKEFQNLDDLSDYLLSMKSKNEFYLSAEEEAELDRRYDEMKNGKVAGIPWEEVKSKFESKLTS